MKIISISSAQNSTLKALEKLRQQKERTKRQQFLVEGEREFLRAISSGYKLEEAFIKESQASEWQGKFLKHKIYCPSVFQVSDRLFHKAALRESTESIVGVFQLKSWSWQDIESRLRQPKLALVFGLCSLEKPGNLGAICRIADAVGACGIVASGQGSDPFHPQVIRASTGCVFSLPVVKVSSIEEMIAFFKKQHLEIICADGSPQAQVYTQATLAKPLALILGAESTGVPSPLRETASCCVSIPMRGISDSLNVSVAAGILAYEALRQWKEMGSY